MVGLSKTHNPGDRVAQSPRDSMSQPGYRRRRPMTSLTLRRIGWIGASLGLTSVLVGCNDVQSSAPTGDVGSSTTGSSTTQNDLDSINGLNGLNGLNAVNGLNP